MVLNPIPILRIVQGILALIVVGTAGYVVNYYREAPTPRKAPSEVNFLIWNFVWTVLALLYLGLAPTYVPNLYHKWAVVGAEGLSVLFWFCGWVAMAAWLGNATVCFGTVCGCARAAVVFAMFEWIAWCLSFGIVVKAIMTWNAHQNGDAEAGHVPHHHEPKHHGASYPTPPGGANIYEANPSSSDIYYAQPDSPAPAHGMRMPSARNYREK